MDVLQIASGAVYLVLALVAVRFARLHAGSATWWAAATFVVLFVTVLATSLVPPPEDVPARLSADALYQDAVILLLGSFPYLLHRFARALRGGQTWPDRLADAGLVVLIAWILVAPPLPPEDAPQPAWLGAFTVAFLVWWAALLGGASIRLWQLGRTQPGIVRGRTRALAVGAGLMAAALLAGVLGGGLDRLQLLTTLIGWGAAALFLLGLQPPAALRRVWRDRDEADLREAEVGLLAAHTAEAAASAVVGAAAVVVGGAGARVVDLDGVVLAEHGSVADDGLRVRGDHAEVLVAPSRLTPVLGHGEESLLRQLCTHLDLALGRIEALAQSEAARSELERTNADLQQLVYGVSHDLRNPLVTITGFLQLLDKDQDLTERNQMLVERMGASARYMQGLVDDLLQLSRVGHADADREPVHLEQLCRDVALDLAGRYDQFEVDVQPLPIVEMNAVRARQLMANLLENAARYANPGGPVTVVVRATQDDGWAVLDVADDGVGIPPDQRDRVFQIFQRLVGFDAATPGSGIGLTMCRRIVDELGGTIDVADSTVGTTMRVRLPLAARATRTPATRSRSRAARPARSTT